VVFLDADLTAHDTGVRFHDTLIHDWQCGPDGRFTDFRCFCDMAKALAALGVRAIAPRAKLSTPAHN
jgi:hypothetical protein